MLFAECIESERKEDFSGDQQYTFYKIATERGWVDIRWVSNGFYSISVDFLRLGNKSDFRSLYNHER